MKKFTAKIAALLVCAVVIGSCFLTAFAENTSYELDELNMSIPVPNDMLTITRESEKTDSYFSKFSLDYQETMDTLIADDIYLQAMKEDSSLTLTVTMTKNSDSRDIDNYKKLSDEEMNSVKDKLLEDKSYKSASIVDYNNVRYINLTMSTKMGKKIVQAQQYNTVINGENIVISMQSAAGEKFTTDHKELLASIIEGTNIIEQNFFVVYRSWFIYGGASLIGLAVVIVVLVLLIRHLKNPDRKHRHLVHELAHEHRITATTQIPRKHIFNVTKPTNSFLTNYDPVDEIGKPKEENPDAKREIVSDTSYSVKSVSEPVVSEPEIDEILAESDREAAQQYEKKVKRDSKPLPIKRVSEEVDLSKEEVPIAKPMIIDEDEVDKAVEEALKHTYSDSGTYDDKEPEAEQAQPEYDEPEEIPAESGRGEPEEYTQEAEPVEAPEQPEEYFDDIPEEEEMYSYTDVDTAVDEYTAAKRESEQIREDRREVADTFMSILYAIGRGFRAVGRFLLNILTTIGMVIVYIIIHIKYFCVNCYRMFKRSRNKKKRRKTEEARRREESQRRQAQREAVRARQNRNANRGENDLVMVRSSGESRPRPRPGQQQRPQQRRSTSSRPQQRRSPRPNSNGTRNRRY